jgi:integrase
LMLSLRRNEIAHLRWDDRNVQKWFITIFWKGQKFKYLPLNSKMQQYLSDYRVLKQAKWYYSPYIFSPLRNNSTGDRNKPISPSYIFNIVKKVSNHLQMEGDIRLDRKITPHSFRTTFVKLALDSGKTDIEIMNTTWHSTSQMVKYYDSRSALEVNAAWVVDDLFE